MRDWAEKETAAFLVDTVTGERLVFQMNPNDITDDKSTNFARIPIPGMSHPRYQFVSGEARKVSFKIHLFKGPVKDQVTWLQSLLYPEHAGTILKNGPHRVLFVFGDLYPGFLGVVTGAKVRYFDLFDRETLAPQRAEVDLSLEEYVEQSVSYKEIRP